MAHLREGFSESPGALASIRANREAVVEEVSFVLIDEMEALGINWTYASVVDIHYNSANSTIGTRSFGAAPEEIATLASPHFDRLIGDDSVRQKIDDGASIDSITSDWSSFHEQFRQQRAPFLIYGEG